MDERESFLKFRSLRLAIRATRPWRPNAEERFLQSIIQRADAKEEDLASNPARGAPIEDLWTSKGNIRPDNVARPRQFPISCHKSGPNWCPPDHLELATHSTAISF